MTLNHTLLKLAVLVAGLASVSWTIASAAEYDNHAQLFRDRGCSGPSIRIAVGTRIPDLNVRSFEGESANDSVSSVGVGRDQQVAFCTDVNGGGTCWTHNNTSGAYQCLDLVGYAVGDDAASTFHVYALKK